MEVYFDLLLGAWHTLLSLVSPVLLPSIELYLVLLCVKAASHALVHASDALKAFIESKQRRTIGQDPPKIQFDFDMLEKDSGDIGIPVLQPCKPSL